MNLFVFFVCFVLTTCVPTGYVRSISGTAGCDNRPLGRNIFRVSFKGNAYTIRERVLEMLHLRSAALTVKEGYRYYITKNFWDLSAIGSYKSFIVRDTKPTHIQKRNVYSIRYY